MSHQDVFSRISRRSQTQQKEILIVIRNYLTEKKNYFKQANLNTIFVGEGQRNSALDNFNSRK